MRLPKRLRKKTTSSGGIVATAILTPTTIKEKRSEAWHISRMPERRKESRREGSGDKDDFSEILASEHPLMRLAGFTERKDFVEHGPEFLSLEQSDDFS